MSQIDKGPHLNRSHTLKTLLIGSISIHSENKQHLVPSITCKGRKHHRSIIHSRANIVEDESGHEHKLSNLGNNNSRSSKVATNKVPSTIQPLPRAQPEQEVEEFANGHGKSEVGNVGLDLSSLEIIISYCQSINIHDFS